MTDLKSDLDNMRTKIRPAADWLAVGVAVSLPWSTSATGILVGLWLIAVLCLLKPSAIRDELVTLTGALPVALVVLAIAGMAWADVDLRARFDGVESLGKLALIPLLMAQFRQSDNGRSVLIGFLLSCGVLLLASYGHVALIKSGVEPHRDLGVPVKNGPTQSGEFLACIFVLLFIAVDWVAQRRTAAAAAIFALIAAMMIDILYVATSRTTLVVLPFLLVLLGLRKFSKRGVMILLLSGVMLSAFAWFSSAYLRDRVNTVWQEIAHYQQFNARESSGERLEFWKKALRFSLDAPLIGHGTGSIPGLYAKAAQGQEGVSAVATKNPHNQTFVVSIQLGFAGVVLLWAMWFAHVALFRGGGLIGWIGTVIVVQNIVGSLFNSHLSDFSQGWIYVFGVGVAGGMIRRSAAASGRGEGG